MRAMRLMNVALLSALVGSTALGFAQDEKKQEDKPARQEEPKTLPKQEEAKPRQDKQQDRQMEKQEPKRDQEQSRGQAMPEKDKQQHPEMRGERNQQGQERPEARGDHARPTGKGGHIPDEKFRASFGHEHHFNARTVIVQGQPQFQYGGYGFELIDAWPADWAYTDDVYVDYIDGEYFLFDLLHPGVRIALFVVM